ncbi:hypothetical protein AZE42_03837 [Rhizopogon vesiculosus]|uniref:Clp1-like protein n=1 Tax=Rhizopogon vesiculosus TaxID=180088 RepID=A0A1J8QT04_9AGAM|nr:hypothetical protein AZE42_03837 [Rhizopogon vesiculosus]
MAFRAANYVRRFDSENTPPAAHASTKSFKVRNGIQAASRRRRALTSGGVHHPRHAIVHAKKRNTHTPSKYPPSSVRMDVPTLSRDVEMSDATPVSMSTASVSLPRRLARPEVVADIPKSTLEAVAPELANTHMDYILEGLECLGPDMLRVLAGIKAEPVSNVLPKEFSIIVNDLSSDMPTHMFAVFSSRQPATSRRRVTLFPVHNLVFATHCANLPILPASRPALPECAGQEIKVPVVPLCIPAPEVFPQLSAFLYTKRIDHLLGSLLPCPSPPQLYLDDPSTVMPLLEEYAQKLAQTYTAQALLTHVGRVHGMWRNAIALGIADERLWCALDVAWEVLLTSLTISIGKPHLMTETTS